VDENAEGGDPQFVPKPIPGNHRRFDRFSPHLRIQGIRKRPWPGIDLKARAAPACRCRPGNRSTFDEASRRLLEIKQGFGLLQLT
jgi:hypothetical protein